MVLALNWPSKCIHYILNVQRSQVQKQHTQRNDISAQPALWKQINAVTLRALRCWPPGLAVTAVQHRAQCRRQQYQSTESKSWHCKRREKKSLQQTKQLNFSWNKIGVCVCVWCLCVCMCACVRACVVVHRCLLKCHTVIFSPRFSDRVSSFVHLSVIPVFLHNFVRMQSATQRCTYIYIYIYMHTH